MIQTGLFHTNMQSGYPSVDKCKESAILDQNAPYTISQQTTQTLDYFTLDLEVHRMRTPKECQPSEPAAFKCPGCLLILYVGTLTV